MVDYGVIKKSNGYTGNYAPHTWSETTVIRNGPKIKILCIDNFVAEHERKNVKSTKKLPAGTSFDQAMEEAERIIIKKGENLPNCSHINSPIFF